MVGNLHFEIFNLFSNFWNNFINSEIAKYSYKNLTPINEINEIVNFITPINVNNNTPNHWGYYSNLKRKTKRKKQKEKQKLKKQKQNLLVKQKKN